MFAPVVSEQVALAMNKIKTSHGFGLDEISNFFLKIAMPILEEPVSQLFNLSLSAGVFPINGKLPGLLLFTRMDTVTSDQIIVKFRFYQ